MQILYVLNKLESKHSYAKDEINTIQIRLNERLDNPINKDYALVNPKEGIIGLIANRFLNMFNVPSIAFAVDSKDENILKGSARSKAGFSIVEAYKDESISKYLITSGGHAYAGGLSIKKDDFEAFKQSFDQYASLHPFIDDEKPTIEISLNDINKTNYKTLRTFAPFGMGFE